MHGGVKFYRGSAKAARAYVESDHSRADDYYLAEGSGLAIRYVAEPGSAPRNAGDLDAGGYERWVAGIDVESGLPKGRVREDANALRFVEVTVNGPKTWSLAAALHPEISAALDAAQGRAAEQIIAWTAEHATTRVGPRGGQVQVPVTQVEAAVIRHYTSRAGDPHRHLHLQINARVFAEGKWRGLHSVGFRDMVAAINGIGHAAVATDPEFRAALAAHGFTMDSADGELTELTPYVGRFSARAAQIGRNIARYEAEWRAAHPGEEPGPRLRQTWDRHAWADARPDKPRTSEQDLPVDGAAMVSAWNHVLHDLGYRDPAQIGLPLAPAGPSVAALDRDGAAELVISRLGAARSAWNPADIRGGVEEWIAATGLVVDGAVRIELAEDVTARAVSLCVPLLRTSGVPEHIRTLTSPHVLAVEAEIVAALVDRAAGPSEPALLTTLRASLDETQREAVAMLAGNARLVVIEGAAGAGKTTALAAVGGELARQGQRMVVVTPTLKAAQVAERETGARAGSAAAFVREHGWTWDEDGHWSHAPAARATSGLGHGDLLLVDEAGMLDQDTARALLAVADQAGARVALIGDRHQLPAVGRGGVLDLAARWAAPKAVVDLDVIHRFADPEYAAISLAMRTGERLGEQSGEAGGEVFDALWRRGQIRLHATEVERVQAIAAETADLIAGGNGALRESGVVMADSLAQVAALNGAIRDRLVALGHIDNSRTVVTDSGERIGVGDRVATRRNDTDLGVANRDTWTVTDIGKDGSLTLAPASDRRATGRGSGQTRVVPGAYVRAQVELAYATTVYGAQGETTSTGHMLVGDTTSGSAAYVGMTRGRDQNIAHLVAEDLDDARAIWNSVMDRDRADLGPAHAARAAAEELDRYAPQRPLRVMLNRLSAAWTKEADLTEKHARLDRMREQIEAVTAIHDRYRPQLDESRHVERRAHERWEAAHMRARDLESTIDVEQRDVTTSLSRSWRNELSAAYRAAAVVSEGSGPWGPLGKRSGRVRQARDELATWASRWQPLLPDLDLHSLDAGQGAHVLRHLDESRVRDAIIRYAADAVAAAHPEHDAVAREVHEAEASIKAAEQHRADLAGRYAAALEPHRRLAHVRDPAGLLAETQRDLDTTTRQLGGATEQVQRLTRAPEIRSLPIGHLDAVHEQWQADRTTAQQEQAAEAAARRRAAAQARTVEEAARRRLVGPDPARASERKPGPGLGF
ncbi:MobF family relaxase [Nocardioides sp. Kera G14]|uniref:MobF family relaxase n=1 Tax=Nocardioides sp. Kera G14 TaxID=2884264 RepID=UPI001D10DA0D|nr:MobF family relaxase [Nocardioides sp. Kera G14]UDY25043.1 relaxase domain-containing protein [Nocardioides sp. Kera G14]